MATTSKSKSKQKAPRNIGAAEGDTLLQKLFLDSLKDIYYAEKHLVKMLPRLKKAATNEALQTAFDEHTAVTKEQVARLEQVFETLGEKPRAKKCEAIEGLAKEAESIIEDTEESTSTRDVGLILAAQKVEHYEIASYGGLRQLAQTLGYTEAAELLQATLDEEKETDQLLTTIAENDINYQAAEEGGEEEEQ
ncbi:MAG: ferritin-like domain-containing protein [Chitinophagaceae bacterium]|nr:ferritin-like domain-containing protein [Chitinophagaceae bacterium]